MNAPIDEGLNYQVGEKIVLMVKLMQNLSDEEAAAIDREKDLMAQIGFDSLRAFSLVTSLHEMMGVPLPEEMDPSYVATIKDISKYIVNTYDKAVVDSVLSKSEEDIREMLAMDQDFDEL